MDDETQEVTTLPIAVRGYAATKRSRRRKRQADAEAAELAPSNRYLVVDTETTNDHRQQLRFGVYQVQDGDMLLEHGLFYDPIELSDAERSTLFACAASQNLGVHTRSEFIEEVFYPNVYELGAVYLGFNVPFDLSRLAIRHSSARGKMRGGFSFQLSDDPYRPRIQIRHLNSRTALIQFAAPRTQSTPRSLRKKGQRSARVSKPFLDVRTLAGALHGGSWSLASLAEHLDTAHRKLETEEHGGQLTEEYLEYAVNDVQVTWECFELLRSQYERLELDGTPITQIYSEASLGKAYLTEMSIRPWQELPPRFPKEVLGIIMSTYYGGRAEVHIRRAITRVMYCDFLSMYPTVCTLMGLWHFVIAERIHRRDVTSWTRRFLESVTAETLQNPEAWKELTVLVQVQPDRDLFPVRAKYDRTQRTIGLNYLTAEKPMWFTLADCIASTLLTGKPPRVLKAWRFRPVGVQEGLQPIAIAGRNEYHVDPLQDDFYRRLIDLRTEVKEREETARKVGDHALAVRLRAEQLALKLCANATSYGIFVELNVTQLDKAQEVMCYGYEGEGFLVSMTQIERPGRYFHPLLATLITGAARLMLALAEYRAEAEGLSWALCDTDSMAFAKSEVMDEVQFQAAVRRVVGWFMPLNPYAKPGSILKIEEANYAFEAGEVTGTLVPLYCYAVSAKRYALFNLPGKRPVLRKVSAHGLGHLYPPYKECNAPRTVPEPTVPVKDLECERWHHDLWYRTIESALGPTPEHVPLDDLPGFDVPAVSRYAATTPTLLRWFTSYNHGKLYRDQVRPFGFLLSFTGTSSRADPSVRQERCEESVTAHYWKEEWRELRGAIIHEGGIRPSVDVARDLIPRSVLRLKGLPPDVMADLFGHDSAEAFLDHVCYLHQQVESHRRHSRRRPVQKHRPVAPFESDPRSAAKESFDRVTGESVNQQDLRSYAHALAQYHLSPEGKFLNGDPLDSGATVRRHIHAQTIEQIGKEADRWEEQFYLGSDLEAEIEYGPSLDDAEQAWNKLSDACRKHGIRKVAQAAGISHTHVSRLIRGASTRTPKSLTRLTRAVATL